MHPCVRASTHTYIYIYIYIYIYTHGGAWREDCRQLEQLHLTYNRLTAKAGAAFQSEGLASQNRGLLSPRNVPVKFGAPRGWPHFFQVERLDADRMHTTLRAVVSWHRLGRYFDQQVPSLVLASTSKQCRDEGYAPWGTKLVCKLGSHQAGAVVRRPSRSSRRPTRAVGPPGRGPGEQKLKDPGLFVRPAARRFER